MLKRGFLYWAHLDKRRPVLVLSPQARNEGANDVIVIPVSSVLREGPWHVRLQAKEGGIQKTSILKCEQILTLPKSSIKDEPLGPILFASRMKQVEHAVLRAIGMPVADER